MERTELINLAALDALGLLDPAEAEAFNEAFDDAPASLRAEILRIQAAVASDETLLPAENPDPRLRPRVLAAVRDAIERDAGRFAPLATIGRDEDDDHDARTVRSLRRTLVYWRAACFVLLASVLVAIFFFVQSTKEGMALASAIIHDRTGRQVTELIGPDWQEFLGNPNVVAVTLRPEAEGSPAWATIYLNEQTDSVFLMAGALPETSTLLVRVRHADGPAEDVHEFTARGTIDGLRLDNVDTARLASASWEIVDAATGAVLLRA